MKKKSIIVGILIGMIFVMIGIGVSIWLNESKYHYEIEEVTKYQYNLLYVDEKYGVIDENGEIIIDPIYDIIQIPNPTKPVFICMKDYDVEKREYQVTVRNEKQEEIFKEYERVEPIPLKEENVTVPYEKTVLRYRQNGKYGLIDYNGKVTLEAEYDEIQGVSYKEGILKIQKDGKYGVINIKGTKLIPVEYDSIEYDGFYEEKTGYENAGFIVSKIIDSKELYGYHNARGKKVLEAEYEGIHRISEIEDHKKALLIVWKDGKSGVFEGKSQKLQIDFDEIDYDKQSELYIVSKGEKQGVYSQDGKEILPIEYDNIFVSGEYISVQKDGKLTRFDKKGKELEDQTLVAKWETKLPGISITMNQDEKYGLQAQDGTELVKNHYLSLEYLEQEYFIATNENHMMGIIKTDGKSSIELKYNSIRKIENTNLLRANKTAESQCDLYDASMNLIGSYSGENILIEEVGEYIRVYQEGRYAEYFSKDGKKVDVQTVYPDNGIIAKEKDGKWGYTDRQGNLKVDYQYDMVTELNEYGFAGIKLENKWGVINQNGEIVQEPIYELEEQIPEFLGKYYQVQALTAQPYYTNYLGEEIEE